MPTQAEYNAGIAAAMKLAEADLDKDVPMMFRSSVPEDLVRPAVAEMAKAAIDAAEKVRGG